MDIPLYCDVIGCRLFAHVALRPEAEFQLAEYLCHSHWEALHRERPEAARRYAPLHGLPDLTGLPAAPGFTHPLDPPV